MGGKFQAFIKFLVVVTILGAIGLRIYRTFVPDGAEFSAYVFDCVAGPEYPAEGLRPKLNVFFEDNGDDHGGNYHTWLVKDHWLWGKKVLAQGWSTHEVFKGRQDFSLKWLSEAAVEVKFLTRKIGGALEPMVVAIPQDR